MFDVSVRQRVVALQVEEVESAVGKRVAFVRVIVLVFCKSVVRFKAKAVTETLANSRREAAVRRFSNCASHHDLAKVIAEDRGTIGAQQPSVVKEASHVDALGICLLYTSP